MGNPKAEPKPGAMFYLEPWWVEVVSFSPKLKIVRFRKLSRSPAPIERMGRLAFERMARAG